MLEFWEAQNSKLQSLKVYVHSEVHAWLQGNFIELNFLNALILTTLASIYQLQYMKNKLLCSKASFHLPATSQLLLPGFFY